MVMDKCDPFTGANGKAALRLNFELDNQLLN